jgi:hypothetical protein
MESFAAMRTVLIMASLRVPRKLYHEIAHKARWWKFGSWRAIGSGEPRLDAFCAQKCLSHCAQSAMMGPTLRGQ